MHHRLHRARRRSKLLSSLALAAGVAWISSAWSAVARGADGVDFFEQKIRPLLADQCYSCHSVESKKSKGGLSLDTKDGLLAGGENGAVVVAGDPDKSRLIEAVRYTNPDLQMPPKGKKLSPAQVADLAAWVKMGAPDPRSGAVASRTDGGADVAAAREQWAFRSPQDPRPPEVRQTEWVKSPIDRFILRKLEDKGLHPAAAADRRTLIRRATYDLTGLPPTTAEVDAFLADPSAEAFAKVVDRLLASPRYGQRWGRHWLDLVRYTDLADSRSLAGDQSGDFFFSWRYRDWVVDAFNHDLPYDKFVTDQIAGDLLPPADSTKKINAEGITATGVYVFGEWGGADSDREKMLTDIVDDQVDVTGRVFLGLTVACARCHDHKFDPIPTADYYGLAGIFFSSHILPNPGSKTDGSPVLRIPLIDPATDPERKRIDAQIAELNQQIDAAKERELATLAKASLDQTEQYLLAGWELARERETKKGMTANQLASGRGLNAYAVAKWADVLASGSSEVKRLREPIRDLNNIKGLAGWRNPGPSGTPVALANPNDQPASVGTLTVPPHRVTVHPSPNSGAVVGWTSPFAGAVRLTAQIKDGDDKGGDGVEWRVAVRSTAGVRELLSGAIANGGGQDFNSFSNGDRLKSIDVAAGQTIEIAIFPKGSYDFDTTVVDMHIEELAGAHRSWNLARDVAPDIGSGNPHEDHYGSSPWSFYEVSITPSALAFPQGSRLEKWIELARGATAAPDEIKAGIKDVSRSLEAAASTDATSPDAQAARLLSDPASLFWAGARSDEANLSADARQSLKRMREQADSLRKQASAAVPVAIAMQDGGTPGSAYVGFKDTPILMRGRYDRPGAVVPRHFPRVIAGDAPPAIPTGSGRIELARWIASPQNPMTAKVMVNRIWQHHFGDGIVRTPNNFGKLGTPPTHPELLDWLAHRFVDSGWSMKAMHRTIMLSAAYQQSSTAADPAGLRDDADNLLLGRMPRRRLDAESLRDSLLALSGALDDARDGPPVADLASPRRTLYLRTIRSDRSNYRALFDAADPQAITDKRIESTVAPQALFLLNNPFAAAQARALATNALKIAGGDAARVDWLYQRLYARPPEPREIEAAQAALMQWRKDAAADGETAAWTQYAQVLLLSNEFMYVD